jgi:hypothetical protein
MAMNRVMLCNMGMKTSVGLCETIVGVGDAGDWAETESSRKSTFCVTRRALIFFFPSRERIAKVKKKREQVNK